MRVLIVEFQGRGGFWHYAQALSGALHRAGISPALVTATDCEPPVVAHVPVLRVGGASAGRDSRVSAGRLLSHAARIAGLRGAIDSFRPQIIHLQGPIGALDFLYVRWFRHRGLKVVYTAHNPRPRRGRGGWFHRIRHETVDAIFVLSEGGRQDLLAEGIPPGKVRYVPHGNYLQFVPTRSPSRSEARQALNLPVEARIVLFFGGIVPYKGLDLLIEAFCHLHAVDPDTYLVIAGKAAQGFSGYQAQIDRLALGNSVLAHHEYIASDDVAYYFLSADIVAFPYRRSYQSGSLQLAYAFGRPVVATDTADFAHEVAEDRTGLVAPPDPIGLARAMGELLSNRIEAAAMGGRGRALAESKYGWEAIAAEVVQVYQDLCDPARTLRLVARPQRTDVP